MNRYQQFCIALTLALAGGIATSDLSAQTPEPITVAAKDTYPNGCVSCHIDDGAGKDTRLSTSLGAIEGHPKVTIVANVPADCAKCHKVGTKIEGLNTLMHKVHYGGLEKSEFMKFVQGSCLNCHSLDPKSGKVAVKSGPKNW